MEDNIKMGLRRIVIAGIGWSELAQERDYWRALVDVVLKRWLP
jgi:hypothetical protein